MLLKYSNVRTKRWSAATIYSLFSSLPSRHAHHHRHLLLSHHPLKQPPCPTRNLSSDPTLHSSYIRLLQRCDSVESLKRVHSLLVVNGRLIEHAPVVGELIRGYTHLGNPELALSVYHSVQNPTLALQNLTLRCLSDHELYGHLLSFYAGLQRSPQHSCRHGSDNFTFPFVIKACAAVSAPLLGREVHCRVIGTGYVSNVVVQTALLDMYAKTSYVGYSRRVFDEMSQRDLVSWNALLSGCALNGLDQEALDTFRRILLGGLKPNASTFVSVIPACTRMGAIETGRSLHGLALKSGGLSTQSLMPTLISMYSSCGDLIVAEVLFEMIPEKDTVAWNALVSAYAQNGKHEEAFEAFQQMHHVDTKPALIGLVSILPACGNLVNFRLGESVHACGIKHGFMDKIPVATSLLSMYAKLGDLDAAKFLFNGMSGKNILSWNSMVSGYVLNGQFYLALDTFHKMQLASVAPDSISMVSVLSACSKLKKLCLGRSAHAFCLRSGLQSNQNVMNALIVMYTDCNRFSFSLDLFHKMQDKNLSSWNTLISGSVQLGDPETSISLFRQMQKEGVRFDVITLISILPVFGQVKDLIEGMSFHGYAVKIGYFLDISLVNALINMYMNCDDLEAGYIIFERMLFKDVVSWNVVMTGFRNHNLDMEVMALFRRMGLYSESPNSITLLNVLPMCKNQLLGKSIHGYAVRNFNFLEDSLLTSIMCMYSRFENVNSCFLLFEISDKTNVVVWNTLMSVGLQSKYVERAVSSFRTMLELKMEPDHVTILNLVSACAQLGSLDLAVSVTAYIVKKGFQNTTAISNALIDMHARCGSISMARQVFDNVIGKDCVSWSAIINSYGMHGNGETALSLFTEMQEAGIEPDYVTFLGVLSACSHAGLVEQGKNVFGSMTEDHHVIPRREHIACMVDLLGRTGHLDEAYDLLKSSPFAPTPSMLESLLGACSSHGNIALGEELGRLLSWTEPNSSRSFVMLSNVYAAVGQWNDSCRVRSDMEVRGLRKEPGFSLIQVK